MMYIELILADNFAIDFLLLYASMRSSAARVKPLRLSLAALAGGVYAVLSYVCGILGIFPVKLAFGIVMCGVAAGFSRRMLKDVAVRFFAVSFIFAGVSFGIAAAAGDSAADGHMRIIRLLLIGGVIAVTVYESLIRRVYTPKGICTAEACFGGSSVVFSAVPDPCAVLKDGGGGGVILADKSLFADRAELFIRQKKYKTRSFYIRTASGTKRLTGIMPDELTITDGERVYGAKAYIVLAENIEIDGCRALLGRGIRMTVKEENSKCKDISKTC